MKRCRVPAEYQTARTKPEIALAEIDRVMAAGVRFGSVLADAGYGLSARRQALRLAALPGRWHPSSPQGLPCRGEAYPAKAARGRPRKRHIPDILSVAAEDMLADAKWQSCELAKRHEGPAESPLCRCPCAYRRRTAAADQGHGSTTHAGRRGLADRRTADVGREESGQSIGQDRAAHIAAQRKRDGSANRRHQQLKEELGLDHFEGRSWQGLHRHALMTMMLTPSSASPPENEAGNKNQRTTTSTKPTGRGATPSSSSSLDCRLSDARTADDGSAPSRRMNKSAKAVLSKFKPEC